MSRILQSKRLNLRLKYVKRLITPVAIRNNALLEVKYFACFL